eukprot:764399-Hanusia_phi.AAC.1
MRPYMGEEQAVAWKTPVMRQDTKENRYLPLFLKTSRSAGEIGVTSIKGSRRGQVGTNLSLPCCVHAARLHCVDGGVCVCVRACVRACV